MKVFTSICSSALVIVLVSSATAGHAQQEKKALNRSSPTEKDTFADAELARLRADVIEKMRESRAQSEKLLALHEQEKERLTKEYQERRSLYAQGLISGREVTDMEVALTYAITRVHEVKRWISEDEIAISEATLRDELLRLPALALGGYSETAALIRFNGTALWSLGDAPRIQEFFNETFGRALPISAFGQTSAHDRMKFDHREAIDVALHPDSNEGRSLLGYLRQAGIPFIAFRNAVPGAATGAHIHIGKPSIRNTSR
ncbi:MAG: hypothetical protein ACREQ7_09330 [Candidatus Binatia bacterium]